jgi:hypothetical protein
MLDVYEQARALFTDVELAEARRRLDELGYRP